MSDYTEGRTSMSRTGAGNNVDASALDAHLSFLGAQIQNQSNLNNVNNPPRARSSQGRGTQNTGQRYSAGRNSVSSTTSSHRSLQNVTNTLDMQRISTEISDTENSIRALEREIENVERRHEAANSAYGDSMYQNELDDASEEEFPIRHSRPRTFRPYFTLFFLFACFVMFIVEIGLNSGKIEDVKLNPLIGPSVDILLKLGAKETELLQDGEVWRLVAPMVLHVGVVHLLANMLGLVAVGIPMEQEFGTWRVATVCLSSGFFGIVLSALFAPQIIGVGASGAIFGLFGAAWADLIQNWHTYRGKNTRMLTQLILYTLINFAFGLMPFLDNFAHLGGFFCGLIVGMALLVKEYGDVKVHRNMQICLRATSVIVLPILVTGMLFLLFFGFDLAKNCGFCSYLSCVPFPPGANKNNRWWDCTPCTNGFGDYANFTQGTGVDIICPDGKIAFAAFPANLKDLTEAQFKQDFIAYCSMVCES